MEEILGMNENGLMAKLPARKKRQMCLKNEKHTQVEKGGYTGHGRFHRYKTSRGLWQKGVK